MTKHFYTHSRFHTIRQKTRSVPVGSVTVGGDAPIRIQSMTTTPTQDVDATVKQSIALAEAGCEIVRITAQNVKAAEALKDIRKQFSAAGFSDIPLVADIHFLKQAAMEAIEHVEKVRINPGNYADKKKFAILEYTDAQYQEELDRLHEAFTPLVLRAQELGKTLRIGTNHGSLSDRIMNRYGDTPEGMVESALEFVRIAEHHGFQNLVLSLKASNPKVMIEAYRLAVSKMQAENMAYPLHLGVTEAGEGEDARIKSAVGIGSLLYDGIGDTIRVSLTEDPVYEIPIARDLAERAMKNWQNTSVLEGQDLLDSIDPFTYNRRPTETIRLSTAPIGSKELLRVILPAKRPLSEYKSIVKDVCALQNEMKESKPEGLLLEIASDEDLSYFNSLYAILEPTLPFFVLEVGPDLSLDALKRHTFSNAKNIILARRFEGPEDIPSWAQYAASIGSSLAIDAGPSTLAALELPSWKNILCTASKTEGNMHPLGTYRKIAEVLRGKNVPIWIRNTASFEIQSADYFTAHLLESSMLSGSLMCDGLGDLISIESEPNLSKSLTLAYNILQATRLRMTKTEFVACPSCGRTLFDLQSTTLKIKEKTGHLKGVTIAVMGCIVNGPGEMADADFGYVGGAPGKVNLYVGKECVEYHIPEDAALDKLVDLIKKHGKWVEPETCVSV